MSLIQRKIPMRKSFAALILIFWFQTLPDISITNFEIQRETQRESDCDGVNVWTETKQILKSPFLGLIYVHSALIFIYFFFDKVSGKKHISHIYFPSSSYELDCEMLCLSN